MLGICYGMHLICESLGGRVKSTTSREYGRAECNVLEPNALFESIPDRNTVWMSHGDQVSEVTGDFVPLAATATCPLAAVKYDDLPIYGLQFHPEVTHSVYGRGNSLEFPSP